jgi:hypothetical protein
VTHDAEVVNPADGRPAYRMLAWYDDTGKQTVNRSPSMMVCTSEDRSKASDAP